MSPKIITTPLGRRLQLLLNQTGESYTELAHAVNVPVMTIRRLISGETQDPRLSTLRCLAEHFNISIDALILAEDVPFSMAQKKIKPYAVPKISWQELPFNVNKQPPSWEHIFIQQPVSDHAFALESKPALFHRFPQGTLFIFDPKVSPEDGDTILVEFTQTHAFSLKYFHIDPPQQYMTSLITQEPLTPWDDTQHHFQGTLILTLHWKTASKHSSDEK